MGTLLNRLLRLINREENPLDKLDRLSRRGSIGCVNDNERLCGGSNAPTVCVLIDRVLQDTVSTCLVSEWDWGSASRHDV